ncbi:MAG: hypothetical protein GF418_17070 [Chitinivibrionales bacterium]|nr:hypothetical protein [Chitinivibrionales bacterium]MBD3397332.1 hypothetical protein [Chitinivibrionales bacterium]
MCRSSNAAAFPGMRVAAAVALIALNAGAAQYRLLKRTESSVAIAFSLDAREARRLCTGGQFMLGIASMPDARAAVSAVLAKGTPGPALAARPLHAGWMGRHYLQWISFGAARRASGVSNALPMRGTITVSLDRAVWTASGPVPPVTNNMLLLPVRSAGLRKTAAVSKPSIACTVGVKIEIDADGICEITASQLRELGVPISRIPSRSYRLHNRDTEVPVFFTNGHHPHLYPDDRLLFYGRHLRGEDAYYTQYSNTNIYWLTWDAGGAGLRVAEVSGAKRREQKIFIDIDEGRPQIAAREFPDTIHIEYDNDVRWLGDIYESADLEDSAFDADVDNWYWEVLGVEELTDFVVDVPSPSTSTARSNLARMRIALMGLASLPAVNNDHQFQVLLNGSSPSSAAQKQLAVWDGQTEYVFVSDPFPVTLLKHGQNVVSLAREPSRDEDRVALNWIEIEYIRGFTALGDMIAFRNHPDNINSVIQFELTGFTAQELELWDIEKHRIFNEFETRKVTADKKTTYTLVFQDSITSNTRYLAQSVERRIAPARMRLDTIRDNWEFGADYIMIANRGHVPLLEPLKETHEARGLTVELVDMEDIFNRFSYGIRDPESIRTMLAYVFGRNTSSPPRFVLLAGDASHDLYKNESRRGLTEVPTHLTRVPGWGPGADDGYFATFRGEDNFADVAIGRIPAQDSADLAAVVNKTVGYIENLQRGYWKDNIVLAGGRESDFTALNNEFASDIIGPRMHILRMDADPASPYLQPASSAGKTMTGFINAGAYMVNFAGHGGGNVWSDNEFFSFRNLPDLHNGQWGESGRLPIILSFTCLTGFFESVFYRSLGEEVLRLDSDGAIAFYGASAYSKKTTDINLDKIIIDNAVNGSFSTLGELLAVSEMMMLIRFGEEALPTVRQYNLLGDPALPFGLAPDSLDISLASSTLRGADTVEAACETGPVTTGTAKVRVLSGTRQWDERLKNVRKGSFSYSFAVPRSVSTANGVVRAYAWNDSSEVRGWATFTKDTVLVHDVRVSPDPPSVGDSVTVRCKAAVEDTAGNVRIRALHTVVSAFEDEANIDWTRYPELYLMRFDSASGFWETTKKLPTGMTDAYDVNWVLMVKFQVTGSSIAESPVYTFELAGRPDLTFTDDTLAPVWEDDSLRLQFQILNKGSIDAPKGYTVTFFWGDTSSHDTLFHTTGTTLAPAATEDFTFAIPDFQGPRLIRGFINLDGDFSEIATYNNEARASVTMAYANLRSPSDTLRSLDRGLCLSPADTLRKRARVFLFTQRLAQDQPLATESAWLPLTGERDRHYSIAARPALSAGDSLAWRFALDPSGLPAGLSKARKKQADSAAVTVFAYDTTSGRWYGRGGAWQSFPDTFALTTTMSGPFSPGTHVDHTPPVIQLFVAGREVLFLDYAAKGKPFNVFITDPSGVAAGSIQLLLNGTPLDESLRSDARAEEDGSTVTLTAYPPPQRDIDSLTIIADDYAGNEARKVFAYMPGEDLRIRFLSCHPNPFSAKPTADGGYRTVRFAYLLTDIATEVTLSVYTIAGRKVWTWKGIDLIGYQEVPWNGLTSDGYRLANGTYYAKLAAKNSSKSVKKITKIAKLEGY